MPHSRTGIGLLCGLLLVVVLGGWAAVGRADHSEMIGSSGEATLTYLPLMMKGAAPSGVIPFNPSTTRLSISTSGAQGDDTSYLPSISADGRYVAFSSFANTLVPGAAPGEVNVFVRDRMSGQTTMVSISSSGTPGDGISYRSSISSDGRYVVFESDATNLVASDTNNARDIFLHDRQTGQTTRISRTSGGAQANGRSERGVISANGRYIVFDSVATNLVAGDTNNASDVFLHDRDTGQTSRLSQAAGGEQGNGDSFNAVISADGGAIAFLSSATNLVSGDSSRREHVIVRDRASGVMIRASSRSTGEPANSSSYRVAISHDGQIVSFLTDASNLAEEDNNGDIDVFVHDRATHRTDRVSISSQGAQANDASWYHALSGDGRYVAFQSRATNLVVGDTNGAEDIFLHDRYTRHTTRISVASNGAQGNALSHAPSLSVDGRYIAFDSEATNLVAGDTNNLRDVFVHDRTGR